MNTAVMMVCLAGTLGVGQSEDVRFRAPNLQVIRRVRFQENKLEIAHNMLLFHGISLGMNYEKPKLPQDTGNPDKDRSRLATSYYHPESPVGVALKKFNWSPGPANTYHADARLAASMFGMGHDPCAQLVNLWSEPPIAFLGLEVGTIASYARPTQIVHFVAREPIFVKLSLPDKGGEPHFHYIRDALQRGAQVKVFEGETRPTFAKVGGDGFYHLIAVEIYDRPDGTYLKELMTREGMKALMSKLTDDGVLCYHISDRYHDFAIILGSVAADLQYACLEGRNSTVESDYDKGAYSSSWVMVARKKEHLRHLTTPPAYAEWIKNSKGAIPPYWSEPKKTAAQFVFTDKGKNSFNGIYLSDPVMGRLQGWLRDGEFYFQERLSIRYTTTDRFTRPMHDILYELSVRMGQERNKWIEKDRRLNSEKD